MVTLSAGPVSRVNRSSGFTTLASIVERGAAGSMTAGVLGAGLPVLDMTVFMWFTYLCAICPRVQHHLRARCGWATSVVATARWLDR